MAHKKSAKPNQAPAHGPAIIVVVILVFLALSAFHSLKVPNDNSKTTKVEEVTLSQIHRVALPKNMNRVGDCTGLGDDYGAAIATDKAGRRVSVKVCINDIAKTARIIQS